MMSITEIFYTDSNIFIFQVIYENEKTNVSANIALQLNSKSKITSGMPV
jgi:hypothetical protein